MTHLAFSKSLATGIVSVTSADDWDTLKYYLSTIDYHDTEEWDTHLAWENFRDGCLIKDSASIWRYLNLNRDENFGVDAAIDFTIFEGELIDLSEVDPIFD